MADNTFLYTIMDTNDAENRGLSPGVETAKPADASAHGVGENLSAGVGVAQNSDGGGGGSEVEGGGSGTFHSEGQNFIHKGTPAAEPPEGVAGGDVGPEISSPVLPSIDAPQGTEKREKEGATGEGDVVDGAELEIDGSGEAIESPCAAEKKEGGAVAEPVSEAELAADVGLTRQKLGQLRVEHELLEGTHWKKKGRAVVYLPQGQLRVLSLLGLPTDRLAAKKETVRRDLWVVVRCRNARMVLAAETEAEARARSRNPAALKLRVRVRNNANFRTGMKLPACRAVDEAHGLWELPGKMPRHPGRW